MDDKGAAENPSDGVALVVNGAWGRSWWFRPFGASLGVGLAYLLGWLSVPNVLVPYDLPGEHTFMALASAFAVAPWCWLLARRAARAPISTAIGLFVLTYVCGIVGLLVSGAIVGKPQPSSYTLQDEAAGLFDRAGILSVVIPWIAVGAWAWTTAVAVLGSTTGIGARALRRAVTAASPEMKWFAVVTLVAVGLTAASSGDLRPAVAQVPPKPIVHRPTVVGVVRAENGLYALLEDETTTINYSGEEDLGPDRLHSGCLVFAGDTGGPWYGAWCDEENHAGRPKYWRTTDSQWAWDEGAFILFENGLELPKVPGFSAYHFSDNDGMIHQGGESIYPPHQGAAYFTANERGEVTSWDLEVSY